MQFLHVLLCLCAASALRFEVGSPSVAKDFQDHYHEHYKGTNSPEEKFWEQRWQQDKMAGRSGLVFVDVGAGMYGDTWDRSLAFDFVDHLGCNSGVRSFGFEPQQEVEERTVRTLHTENYPCLTYEVKAMSNQAGNLTMYGRDSLMTAHASHWQDTVGSQRDASGEIITRVVPAVTLDAYAKEKSVGFIDYMKIDTEGHDWFVLQGMLEKLGARQVGIITLEHSAHWNSDYNSAWAYGKPVGSSADCAEPNLKSVVEFMADYGYLGFMIGTVSESKNFLLPLSGENWNDGYDVCLREFCFDNILFAHPELPTYQYVKTLIGFPSE